MATHDPTRRVLIKTGGVLALTATVPLLSHCRSSDPAMLAADSALARPLAGATVPAKFLDPTQLRALRALVDRLIPGQPEDLDPGAVAALCAEAIDHLLAAFQTTPPFIYAGAPFSDRGGHDQNNFLEFIPLDAYEELAWRIAIEGSQGRPEREFNGPVKGMQQIYLEGLARLEAMAQAQGFDDFSAMPGPLRDLLLADPREPAVQDLLDIAFPDTLDAMYGAPEYGGNHALAGWTFTAFDGDVQPRGYTAEQVMNADNPGLLDDLPSSLMAANLPSLLAGENMAAVMMDAQGSLRRLRLRLQPMAQKKRSAWNLGATRA